jgi:hypothetical protein
MPSVMPALLPSGSSVAVVDYDDPRTQGDTGQQAQEERGQTHAVAPFLPARGSYAGTCQFRPQGHSFSVRRIPLT